MGKPADMERQKNAKIKTKLSRKQKTERSKKEPAKKQTACAQNKHPKTRARHASLKVVPEKSESRQIRKGKKEIQKKTSSEKLKLQKQQKEC